MNKSVKNGQFKVYKFACDYCHKGFMHETNYLKHRCKLMERKEALDSPTGQLSWEYYKKWMIFNKRGNHSIETFLTSKYYNSFNKFVSFVKKTKMVDPVLYIKLMVASKLEPVLWVDDEVYSLYLEYLEKKLSPMESVKISLNTILKLSDQYECDVNKVFQHLSPEHFQSMLRSKRLSPWLLLNSKCFLKVYKEFSQDDKNILNSLIRFDFWKRRFDNNPQDLAQIKTIINQVNL